MKLIFHYLKPYVPRMSVGLFIKFIGTIMDLLIPWILSYLIDEIVPQKSMRKILLFGGIMVLCSVTAWLTNILANRMASKVARDTTERLRHDLFRKVSYLSCRQVDDFTVPSLESRLTTDTYNIHQMIGMMQRLGVRAPILLVGGVFVTLTLEPVLTLVLLAVMPFAGGVVWYISQKGIPLYARQQRAVDTMVRTVRENASGIRVIKALSKSDYERKRFQEINRELVKRETKASVTMAASNPLMNLFLNVGLTLVVIAGAFRVYAGVSKPGVILAFLTYFTIILNALLSVNRMFMLYSKGVASAGRIREVLEAPEDLEIHTDVEQKSTENYLSFEHVSFSYRGGAVSVSDIDFTLKEGQTLGIIGGTGSGKTTLIKLLMRFYDPQKGCIRIEGQDIRSIPSEKLHTLFGVVFQNDVLFSDTIAENIRFGRDLEKEKLDRAAKSAQASEFIDSLEEGMEYRLAIRGSNLSGGQKQRVLIARALAADSPILILDDSSSALDYRTDARLRQVLKQKKTARATILVAQRVSSIRHADLILVLDGGKIIGKGTHAELMKNCETYREIAAMQMGGGEEDCEKASL